MIVEFLSKIIVFGPPLVVAIMLHEIAHGWIAWKLGDPTAHNQGRLSLNPLRHVDPMMTIVLPTVLIMLNSQVVFGAAKPVPVNALNFRHPRRGMMLVALAGPVTNFLLAIICLVLFRMTQHAQGFFGTLLSQWFLLGLLTNLFLGLFNLIPIPPLDGGRVAVGLLPLNLARGLARLEPYGFFILVALLYMGVVEKTIVPIMDFGLRFLG